LGGKATYRLGLASQSGASTPHVEFWVHDDQNLPGPVLVSHCGDCFDAAHPPPDAGWNPWGNHGSFTEPVELLIWYDETSTSWTWYVNSRPVRLERRTLAGPGTRVSLGATTNLPSVALGALWLSHVRPVLAPYNWDLFAPNMPRLHVLHAQGLYSSWYLNDGSLAIGDTPGKLRP
jgi:hypothetical protein